MSGPSYSAALYDCATECALRRRSGSCKHSFGSKACAACCFNVEQYIHAEPAQVRLFMMQAESRAYSIKSSSKPFRFIMTLLIGACLIFTYMSYEV